jgi:hypothetical protein
MEFHRGVSVTPIQKLVVVRRQAGAGVEVTMTACLYHFLAVTGIVVHLIQTVRVRRLHKKYYKFYLLNLFITEKL